jgi:hypothetical protein
MLLRCPSCDRTGNFPDQLALGAHTIRCRKCSGRFSIIPGQGIKSGLAAKPSFKVSKSGQAVPVGGGLTRSSNGSFFSGHDDDPVPGRRGPGDSHYEMSAVFEDTTGDSDVEIAAYRPASGASPDEAHPSGAFEAASSEVLLPSPWYYNFIDSWSRFHFFVALAFGTSSLSFLGFLLVRALVGGQIIDSSITSLIVGCVGTVAFLLLSV